jgi:hypothetical protein
MAVTQKVIEALAIRRGFLFGRDQRSLLLLLGTLDLLALLLGLRLLLILNGRFILDLSSGRDISNFQLKNILEHCIVFSVIR